MCDSEKKRTEFTQSLSRLKIKLTSFVKAAQGLSESGQGFAKTWRDQNDYEKRKITFVLVLDLIFRR
jgi:hypothetical protein